jgi:hypothetical protein
MNYRKLIVPNSVHHIFIANTEKVLLTTNSRIADTITLHSVVILSY